MSNKKTANQKKFATISRSCSHAGHKPGTKAFGSCVKEKYRKTRKG